MSTVSRGVRNAFRNTIRTGGVTVILALSVGLALVMLLSLKTVQARIASVKASIGNTITISPAGARGFEGGGTPLTQTNADAVKGVAHVTAVQATLNDRLTPATDTNLASAIDPGTLGTRFRTRGFGGGGGGGEGAQPGGQSQSGTTQTFQIPIQVTGASALTDSAVGGATSVKLTSGSGIMSATTGNVADIGKGLATKNNLAINSTFTAYGATFKVLGIYDAGNTFSNAGMVIPLATEQTLSQQPGQVSSITATVDNIDNVSSTVTAIQSKLGSTADVVSQEDQANNAIQPLENIRTVSFYSLIGSLAAGSVIIFLTMLMIVRERRREIGVLKAIGGSNITIVSQFVTEALTLTTAGAIIGVIGGLYLSNPVLKLLVTSNSQTPGGGGGFAGGGGGRGFGRILSIGGQGIQSLHTVVGYDVLLYGLGAVIVIAIAGSALPAFAIAKVRPAEVMRGE